MKNLILTLTLLVNIFYVHGQNILVVNKAHNHPDGAEYVLLTPMGKVVKTFTGISILSTISDGYIAASEGDNYGYIDATTGEWAIKLIEKGVVTNSNFNDGWTAIYYEDDHSKIIDKKGKTILDNLKGEVGKFEDGLAISVFMDENSTAKYGVYDKTGKLVSPFTEDFIEPFKDGFALKTDSKTQLMGFIDKTGQWVIQPQWKSAYAFSNGVAAVSLESEDDPTYGLIDKRGKLVIDYMYKSWDSFKDGYARVLIVDKSTPDENYVWNFIDPSGKFLMAKHMNVGPAEFFEGKAMFWDEEGNYVGFINKNNKIIIAPEHSFLLACDIYANTFKGFSEGLFPTEKGYIDTTGNLVIKVANKGSFCTADPCKNGLVSFSVYNNNEDNKYRNYLADKSGKILWQSVDNEVYACFPANVYVSMANGSRKKIEEVQVGDTVLDLDNTPSVVAAVEIHSGNFTIGAMTFNTPETARFASPNNLKNTVLLEATLNHPLPIEGKKVAFGDVKTGDKVLQIVHNQIVETRVAFIDKAYKAVPKVYNLKTNGKGYFVNGYGVLVKN